MLRPFGLTPESRSGRLILRRPIAAALVAIACLVGCAAPPSTGAGTPSDTVARTSVEYQRIGDAALHMDVWSPPLNSAATPRPAVVFFFGGGWNGGTTEQFAPHCERLAAEGFVAFSAEYRVQSRHAATPFDCVADGRSALHWIRNRAADYAIDPDRIYAAGGSAGGHVAVCAVASPPLDEQASTPGATPPVAGLVLFNPVIDTSAEGYGHARVGERWREISPRHLVRPGLPPTLVFHGTADTVVPIHLAEAFRDAMHAADNTCTLIAFDGLGHGFFNADRDEGRAFETTMERTIEFLRASP